MRRSSGTYPSPRWLIRNGCRWVTGSPSKWISPREGRTSPMMVLSVVDLPAPFRPSSATTSPEETRNDTSARISARP